MKARKWVVRSHFVGQPKREDLEIVEEELPPIKDGGQEVGERAVVLDEQDSRACPTAYTSSLMSVLPAGGKMIFTRICMSSGQAT